MPKPSRWSGAPYQVDLVGLEAIDSKLDIMLKGTENLNYAFKNFYTPAFYDAEKGWFATDGEGTWAPQDRQYAAWKAKNGGGSLMVLTGMLRKSLVQKGSKYATAKYKGRYMEIGTSDPVANLHITKRARTRRIAVVGPESDILKATITGASQKHADWYEKVWSGRGAV